MRHPFLSAALIAVCLPAVPARADDLAPVLERVVSEHVLPGFDSLTARTAQLAEAASASCDPADPTLRAAFDEAWRAWASVAHLRFGPTEAGNRAFALEFWPDTRGAIPKTLAGLVAQKDPAVTDPEAFKGVSIAARGFTALEMLLYDPAYATGDPYTCQLVQAVATDISLTAAAIGSDWSESYGKAFTALGEGAPYRTAEEAMAALFTAALTGLEFTEEARLGRPMGTFEEPRPTRAEAWRSANSVPIIRATVEAPGNLAGIMAATDAGDAAAIADSLERALRAVDRLQDPSLADLATPEGRFRAETAQQRIDELIDTIKAEVGDTLGLAQGFNSLDGD